MLIVISVVIILLSMILFRIYWKSLYFERKNIKHLPIDYPLIGNMYSILTKKQHMKDIIYKAYNDFSNQKYFGYMQLMRPVVVIRDIELIRKIAVKDFDYFTDHQGFINEDSDPLFGRNLFALKGKKWREMRATLSPAFTSLKMKAMFELVADCAKNMTNYYMEKTKRANVIDLELKDAFTRYANDVIASAAFGIEIDSFKENENEFYKMGRNATTFGGFHHIKILLFASFPNLMKMTGLTFFGKEVNNFFSNIVLTAMKERENMGIIRNDMIHLLMKAKKGDLKYDELQMDSKAAGFATVEESNVGKQIIQRKWSDIDIIAQVLLFLLAGFDTSSILLCFMAHELAINRDVQDKLQREIDDIVKVKGYNLSYEDLNKLKYMDMTVSETLRMWPPVVHLDRICTSPYKLPPPNESSKEEYLLECGNSVIFPAYSIQHDPENFPNPEKFDPERFSEENKSNIKPFSFIPFGVGPRNCIGSRFALMETKALMFHLLAKFNFTKTSKTEDPLTFEADNFILTPINGFWIGLEPRSNS